MQEDEKKFIEGGYILVARKWLESDIFDKPPEYLKLRMWILKKANYMTITTPKGITFHRGEFLTNYPEMLDILSYKIGFRPSKKLAKKSLWSILDFFRKERMIETRKTTRGLYIKVCDYDVYQNPKSYERNDEVNDEREQGVNSISKRKINEGIIKEKEYKKEFLFVWERHPRKKDKGLSYKHYLNSVHTDLDQKEIERAAENYRASPEVKAGKIMNDCNWFKEENWRYWSQKDKQAETEAEVPSSPF